MNAEAAFGDEGRFCFLAIVREAYAVSHCEAGRTRALKLVFTAGVTQAETEPSAHRSLNAFEKSLGAASPSSGSA